MENRRACAVPLAASYWNCDMMEGSGQPRSSTSWTVHRGAQNTTIVANVHLHSGVLVREAEAPLDLHPHRAVVLRDVGSQRVFSPVHNLQSI